MMVEIPEELFVNKEKIRIVNGIRNRLNENYTDLIEAEDLGAIEAVKKELLEMEEVEV